MPTNLRTTSTLVIVSTTLVVVIGSLCALVGTAGAAAGGGTYFFAAPSTKPDRMVFTLGKRDKTALRAQKRASAKRVQADRARNRQTLYASRIAHVETLIADAESAHGTMRLQVERRLVERYKSTAADANADDLAFLLAAESMGDVIERSSLLGEQSEQDAQLLQEYEVTTARLAQLQQALDELREAEADRTLELEEQADELDQKVAGAREAHVEASASRPLRKGAGQDGTWLIAPDGGFGPDPSMLAAFTGRAGGTYNGGARTPARPANAAQIAAALNHPQLDIYAGGRLDIARGMVDGRVLDALVALATRFGGVRVTSIISGHGVYTTSGNISMHTLGCAVDIGSVSNIVIQSSTQGPGSITEQSVLFLAGLPGDLSPHQVISLNSYGGPTLAMGDHHDHIHLGYSC